MSMIIEGNNLKKRVYSQRMGVFVVAATCCVVAGGMYIFLQNNTLQGIPTDYHFEESTVAMATISSEQQEDLSYKEKFEHPSLPYSFLYPTGFSISQFTDSVSGADTVLVQNADPGVLAGFQIVTTLYEGELPITPQLIERDIPDMRVGDAQEVLLGDSGRGLAFVSQDVGEVSGPQNREVWFVINGSLYQITARIEHDMLLKKVLDSWQFDFSSK